MLNCLWMHACHSVSVACRPAETKSKSGEFVGEFVGEFSWVEFDYGLQRVILYDRYTGENSDTSW